MKTKYKLALPFVISLIALIANFFTNVKVDSNGLVEDSFILVLIAYMALFYGIAQIIFQIFCNKFQQKK